MKIKKTTNLYLLLFFVLSLGGQKLQAQPVIDTSVYPVAGTSVRLFQFSDQPLQPGFEAKGSHQVWNLSYLKTPTDTGYLGYLPVQETPYAAQFPSATIAMTSDKLGYDYFAFEPDGYYLLGHFTPDTVRGLTTIKQIFSNAYTQAFPIEYGQKSKDSFFSIVTIESFITINSKEIKEDEVDASGSLVIGNDTFRDLLRVRTDLLQSDIVYPLHPEAKSGSRKNKIRVYTWWQNGVKVPIFSITMRENHQVIINTNGDTTLHDEVDTSFIFAQEIPRYLNDPLLFSLNLRAYQDRDRQFKMYYQARAKGVSRLIIRDVSGRQVGEGSQEVVMPSMQQTMNFSAKELPAGIYYLTVINGGVKETVKVFIAD